MNVVPRFALTVQRVNWNQRRPISEWCVWIYMATLAPSLASVRK